MGIWAQERPNMITGYGQQADSIYLKVHPASGVKRYYSPQLFFIVPE
jgi:hypothetical protein